VGFLKEQVKHNRQRARGDERLPGGPVYRAVWQERLEHTEYLIEQILALPLDGAPNAP
jgi:hypothetical protein